jgi:hypothetical protein
MSARAVQQRVEVPVPAAELPPVGRIGVGEFRLGCRRHLRLLRLVAAASEQIAARRV